MERGKLMRLLEMVGGLRFNRWYMVMELVKAINAGDATKITASWCDEYKAKNINYYPLDLGNIETWSTHEGDCINLNFYVKEGSLFCEVKIMDGDSFNGLPTKDRFKAIIVLDTRFIHKMKEDVLYKLDKHVEELYELHLENKKTEWINAMKKNILEK